MKTHLCQKKKKKPLDYKSNFHFTRASQKVLQYLHTVVWNPQKYSLYWSTLSAKLRKFWLFSWRGVIATSKRNVLRITLYSKNTWHLLTKTKLICSKTIQDFILLKWTKINFRNLKEKWTDAIFSICSGPSSLRLLLIPIYGSLSVLITFQQPRGSRRFSKEAFLPWKIRTGISVGSKKWQKTGFRQCNTMTSTLNAKLLLM